MTVHRISARSPRLAEQFRELLGLRDLFWMLVAREIRIRYKQTALGVGWVVLQPLVPALIFAVVFGVYGHLPSAGAPYFLFALSGLVIFGLFSNTASRAGLAFIRDGALLSKVYLPRPLLPIAAGAAAIIDFGVGFGLIVLLMLGTGQVPPISIVLIPVVAAVAVALGLAVGLAIAALSARFRDFAIAIPFALQVLLYASPIVYSAELIPRGLRKLYALNPLVGITDSFRAALLGGPWPGPNELVLGAAVAVLVIIVGLAIFDRGSRDLVDIL